MGKSLEEVIIPHMQQAIYDYILKNYDTPPKNKIGKDTAKVSAMFCGGQVRKWLVEKVPSAEDLYLWINDGEQNEITPQKAREVCKKILKRIGG